MTALVWTSLFAAALVASLAMRAWLATRQVRHVARHRDEVPLPFRASVELAAHQKAADYTLAKARLGHWQMVFGAVVLLGWTLFGGLDALNVAVREAVAPRFGALAYEVVLFAAFVAIGAAPRRALRVVLDLSPRAALRLQPRHLAPLARRHAEGDRPRRGRRRAAARRRPLDHGRDRDGLVALGLGRLAR